VEIPPACFVLVEGYGFEGDKEARIRISYGVDGYSIGSYNNGLLSSGAV
jgi:hypothetical protein